MHHQEIRSPRAQPCALHIWLMITTARRGPRMAATESLDNQLTGKHARYTARRTIAMTITNDSVEPLSLAGVEHRCRWNLHDIIIDSGIALACQPQVCGRKSACLAPQELCWLALRCVRSPASTLIYVDNPRYEIIVTMGEINSICACLANG